MVKNIRVVERGFWPLFFLLRKPDEVGLGGVVLAAGQVGGCANLELSPKIGADALGWKMAGFGGAVN